MPRRDVPCRQCGKPCKVSTGSRPDPMCRDCMRAQPAYRGPKHVPCAGGCGKICERGGSSADVMMCLDCRRARPGYRPKWQPRIFEPRTCAVCQKRYQPRRRDSLTCSPKCAKERKRAHLREQSRWRYMAKVASAGLPDVLTPDQELAMRHKARRCPMPGCGVRMTDVPFKPNSKELDHIVPRVMGGAHTVGNTRIICRLCNVRRPDDGSDIAGQIDLFATVL